VTLIFTSLPTQSRPPFDDDHRAVVQIADPWPISSPGLTIRTAALARQEHRLERVGDVVEVDHLHVVQPGDLVQVVVARDDLAFQVLGQQHEFHIDRLAGHLGQFAVVDLQIDAIVVSQAIENIQPAAAAGSPQLVPDRRPPAAPPAQSAA
jgi:hypothetical protein